MITDSLLQLFVRTLGSHKHVKRGSITRYDWAGEGISPDVGRVLTAVGGWKYGDFKFTDPSLLETEREAWAKLVTEFEEGRSPMWNHAFWNPAWYPLATSASEVHAFDPIGCFGGAKEQIVVFDLKGGDTWRVFTAISAWLQHLTEGFENEGKDALVKAREWAKANKACVEIKLPLAIEDQRAKQRFDAGIGQWTAMRHPDGRSWAVRERRDGFELRIGEGEDAVIRKRTSPNPSKEISQMVREQKAEGFLPVNS